MYDTVHNLPVKVPHLSVIIGSTAPFVPMERPFQKHSDYKMFVNKR